VRRAELLTVLTVVALEVEDPVPMVVG